MGPKATNDERVELRVRAIDLKCWRDAAEEAEVSLSDWIRRACFNALPSEMQMTVHRHDIAEKRGATIHEVLDDGTGRFETANFLVVKSRKGTKGK